MQTESQLKALAVIKQQMIVGWAGVARLEVVRSSWIPDLF